MPIIPATKVLLRAASPYVASTVREDISFNLVGSEPEFISSTNDVASSVVKFTLNNNITSKSPIYPSSG